MKVNQTTEILCGELINSPAIGAFEGFATKLEDVKRGVLFFASNPNEIDSALRLGAFGIVFDNFVQMADGEIAWIRVPSIREAIIRLLRYQLLAQKIEVYYLNEIQYAIAHNIINTKDVLLFDLDFVELLDYIEKTHSRKIIIKNPQLLDFLLEYTSCPIPETLPFEVASEYPIFESRFRYKLHSYQIPLPSIFLPELGSVLNLCVEAKIDFSFYGFEPIESLLPISIAKDARILPFGRSNRVLIPTNHQDIFLRYASFLQEKAKWGKTLICVPELLDEDKQQIQLYIQSHYLEDTQSTQEIFKKYASSNDLPDLFRKTDFNFGLIFGISFDGLKFILNQEQPAYLSALF